MSVQETNSLLHVQWPSNTDEIMNRGAIEATLNGETGACVLTCKDGRAMIFTGFSSANSCAENEALGKARLNGFNAFRSIVIASSDGKALPCSECVAKLRQFSPEMDITCIDKVGTVIKRGALCCYNPETKNFDAQPKVPVKWHMRPLEVPTFA